MPLSSKQKREFFDVIMARNVVKLEKLVDQYNQTLDDEDLRYLFATAARTTDTSAVQQGMGEKDPAAAMFEILLGVNPAKNAEILNSDWYAATNDIPLGSSCSIYTYAIFRSGEPRNEEVQRLLLKHGAKEEPRISNKRGGGRVEPM